MPPPRRSAQHLDLEPRTTRRRVAGQQVGKPNAKRGRQCLQRGEGGLALPVLEQREVRAVLADPRSEFLQRQIALAAEVPKSPPEHEWVELAELVEVVGQG